MDAGTGEVEIRRLTVDSQKLKGKKKQKEKDNAEAQRLAEKR
jgi:hypothetical protein